MGLNDITSAQRTHIGFFGLRNAGKSSLINAIIGQDLSIVSEIPGTTTDPVRKSMELLPLGPVVIVDTPGLDDEGPLGEMRVQKTMETLASIDIGVLVCDITKEQSLQEKNLLQTFQQKQIPYLIVYNKSDLADSKQPDSDGIFVSAKEKININYLKEQLGLLKKKESGRPFISDIVNRDDIVVLVTPIDSGAPKGRLILPQQQTIRHILDCGGIPCIATPNELPVLLKTLSVKPSLVITDSQVFGTVSTLVPRDIPLTSFSILFARHKGNLSQMVKGAYTIDALSDGDTILISEGCTHHRQCEDIGTVKLPAMLRKYSGKDLNFQFTSGKDFIHTPSTCALVLHCGGCMLTETEMAQRMTVMENFNIPMTNYGMALAHMNGILERSLEPFK